MPSVGVLANDEVIRTGFFTLGALPQDLALRHRTYIGDVLVRCAGRDVRVRMFEARWPLDEQDSSRQAIEWRVRGDMSLAEGQCYFAKQILANPGELADGHS
jgi:hypothetical protein